MVLDFLVEAAHSIISWIPDKAETIVSEGTSQLEDAGIESDSDLSLEDIDPGDSIDIGIGPVSDLCDSAVAHMDEIDTILTQGIDPITFGNSHDDAAAELVEKLRENKIDVPSDIYRGPEGGLTPYIKKILTDRIENACLQGKIKKEFPDNLLSLLRRT